MAEGRPTRLGRDSFCLGLRAGFPIVTGVIPFGVIYGAAAASLGLSLAQTTGMSLAVFAGSSQLVFLDLWGHGAGALALVVTGLVVNLRMAMYSASIAPHLGPLSFWQALFGAYYLTDEGYGVSMGHFLRRSPPASPFHFFLGAAFPTWLGWQVSGLAGYLAGHVIPENWPLEMAVPLVFLALLIPMLSRGPKLTAALVAMVLAVSGARLPLNLGLLAAVFGGIAAGLIHSRMVERRPAGSSAAGAA